MFQLNWVGVKGKNSHLLYSYSHLTKCRFISLSQFLVHFDQPIKHSFLGFALTATIRNRDSGGDSPGARKPWLSVETLSLQGWLLLHPLLLSRSGNVWPYWFVMFIGYGSFTLTCVQVWFTSILITLWAMQYLFCNLFAT